MARLYLALALLAACSACTNAFFFPFFPAPFYGGLYGGGLGYGGGGGTTVVIVNGRRLQGAAAPCQSALEVMRSTPELSQLAALAPTLSPKLRDALNSTSGADLTFFAPSNAALASLKAAMPLDAADALMGNGTVLTALLSYAIVPGRRLAAADLAAAAPLRTALGDAVAPLAASGGVLSGVGSQAAIMTSDLQACHATLHVTDAVLLPVPMPGAVADKVKAAVTQG